MGCYSFRKILRQKSTQVSFWLKFAKIGDFEGSKSTINESQLKFSYGKLKHR